MRLSLGLLALGTVLATQAFAATSTEETAAHRCVTENLQVKVINYLDRKGYCVQEQGLVLPQNRTQHAEYNAA